MRDLSADEIEMLTQARERAQKLLDELTRHQADLEKSPPKLDPGALAQGKEAMTNAVASAHCALNAIDDALKIALPRSD